MAVYVAALVLALVIGVRPLSAAQYGAARFCGDATHHQRRRGFSDGRGYFPDGKYLAFADEHGLYVRQTGKR